MSMMTLTTVSFDMIGAINETVNQNCLFIITRADKMLVSRQSDVTPVTPPSRQRWCDMKFSYVNTSVPSNS